MIRVQLPAHLRKLVRTEDEVEVRVDGPATLGSLLDALEEAHPVLRGAIRDIATGQRRALVRYFACERDFSHEGPDTPLPEAVVKGEEPLLIVGAIAGG